VPQVQDRGALCRGLRGNSSILAAPNQRSEARLPVCRRPVATLPPASTRSRRRHRSLGLAGDELAAADLCNDGPELMPTMPPSACLEPRCPGFAVARGRCALHRQTEEQRGYGRAHRVERGAALLGARCEACGCTRNLQRDHVVPVSLGGSQRSSNKRWLCRCPEHRCHDRIGVRRDREPGGAGRDAKWN
jgi:hypothetical protein